MSLTPTPARKDVSMFRIFGSYATNELPCWLLSEHETLAAAATFVREVQPFGARIVYIPTS